MKNKVLVFCAVCIAATLLVRAPVTMAQTIAAVSPSRAFQGERLPVRIGLQGVSANLPGAFVTFSGDGITVLEVNVLNSAILFADVEIRRDAEPGTRDITVGVSSASGTLSIVTAAAAFTVVELAPTIIGINPASGQQGTTVDVEIATRNTDFGTGRIGPDVGVFTFFSGQGIDVNQVTVTSRTTLRANITLRGDAPIGARDITMFAGGEITEIAQATAAFTVTAPPDSRTTVGRIIGVFPEFLVQNTIADLVIAGENTDFEPANSFPGFGGEGITFNFGTQVNVRSATSMVVTVNVDPNSPPGLRDVTVITGRDDAAELVTLRNAFRVIAPGSSLSIQAETSAIRRGDLVRASVSLANIGPAVTVDVYVGLQLPGGSLVFLGPDMKTFVPEMTAVVEGLQLPANLPPINVDLDLNVADMDQPGIYTFFAGLARPGTTDVIGELSSSTFGLSDRSAMR